MKNLFLLIILVFGFSACKKTCPECISFEHCVDYECVLKEECFTMNGRGICYDSLYMGVVRDGDHCFDTLIFNAIEKETSPAFFYFVNTDPLAPDNRTLRILKEISDNEYILGDIFPVCRYGYPYTRYFSRVETKIFADKVDMKIFLQQEGRGLDEPFIDSLDLTLYPKSYWTTR